MQLSELTPVANKKSIKFTAPNGLERSFTTLKNGVDKVNDFLTADAAVQSRAIGSATDKVLNPTFKMIGGLAKTTVVGTFSVGTSLLKNSVELLPSEFRPTISGGWKPEDFEALAHVGELVHFDEKSNKAVLDLTDSGSGEVHRVVVDRSHFISSSIEPLSGMSVKTAAGTFKVGEETYILHIIVEEGQGYGKIFGAPKKP